MGRQVVAGRLGPGGARAIGHQTLRLEHPRRGLAEPLGEGGRGGRQKHRGRPPDRNIRGKRPSWAPGLVEAKHAGKAGAGLVLLDRGYKRKRPQGRAESIGTRGREHHGKTGGEIGGGWTGVSGAEQGARRRLSGEQQSGGPGTRWCIRHRKKADDNGGTRPEMSIQCREAGRTGGTGGTCLGKGRAGEDEAPG